MYSAPSGPNLASIQLWTLLLPPPPGMIARSDSANAGGTCWATPAGSTVTATRLAGLHSSPMSHLSFQYCGQATPLLVSHAVRPTLVAGRGEDGRGLVLRRAKIGARRGRVRTDPGRVQPLVHRIDGQPRDVADAHDVDLRPGLLGSGREQVALRNRIRAIGFRVDPNDLSVQVVGVTGGAPRILERGAGELLCSVVAGVYAGYLDADVVAAIVLT